MVENRAVASGSGTQVAVATPPDGTTSILVFYTHSVNPSVLPNLPYDTVKDLVPMMLIGTSPMVITAHPGRADKRTLESVIRYRPEPLISEATGMWVITEQVLPTAMIRYSEAIGMWVKDACTRRMYGPS
jgi:Tripartite tricarboxylate transporter family receptor